MENWITQDYSFGKAGNNKDLMNFTNIYLIVLRNVSCDRKKTLGKVFLFTGASKQRNLYE